MTNSRKSSHNRYQTVGGGRSTLSRACFGFSLAIVGVSPACADDRGCAATFKDVPIRETTASASSWSNLRKADGSINAESGKLLNEAANSLKISKPSEVACPEGCITAKTPKIIFRSIPTRYLSNYSGQEMCARYEKQTQASPLTFPGRKFATIGDLQGWFSDFSQGSGTDGRALYQKCDGDCSPQYSNTIVPVGDGYSLDAEVVCGHARDKDDNTYRLSTALRWECQKKDS